MAYVLGEVYSEIYLRTLPHDNVETVFYVYSWVLTIHLLDGLAGFILGGEDGERVGSYPLGWIFKLYVYFSYPPFFHHQRTMEFGRESIVVYSTALIPRHYSFLPSLLVSIRITRNSN